jgi:hypothetical protein
MAEKGKKRKEAILIDHIDEYKYILEIKKRDARF